MRRLKYYLIIAITLLFSPLVTAEVYQTPEAFLEQTFDANVPEPQILWISGEVRARAEEILQHRPNTLRTRYWQQGERTAWILEEIGKEKPITVGIVINDQSIENVKVLIFRESRGWEVKYPFFTNQFKQARLDSDLELTTSIDGVTGATLSVRALTKLSRLALFYHQHVTQSP